MKRKKAAQHGRVVPKEILDKAKASVSVDVAAPTRIANCVVCGEEVAPTSSEKLCWVCRRLKISAWHDSDQMPAQD
jgi:hypothetical protein